MKKKLLFVMESLGIGGAEKSLVTLLSQLDYSKYEVDLFLFQIKGEFLDLIPTEVNLLKVPNDFNSFIKNPKESIRDLIKLKKIKLMLYKNAEIINLAFNKLVLKKEYIGWRFIEKSIDILEKEYDAAIGFLEKKTIYFIVDKVKSKNKIGWIHTDYKSIQFNKDLDKKYLEKLNKIVAVSEPCKKSLQEVFPSIKNNIVVIPNLISDNLIKKMANENIKDFEFTDKILTVCTVGRLTEAKGYDRAIECCNNLANKGLNFKWIVIGEGSERNKLEKLIAENKLEDRFILLGSRQNPYPYIKNSDIYVQPSRWEGFGITVSEAKILSKPIVVSNINEFKEQITEDYTGLIFNDVDEMASKIEMLLSDSELRNKLICNLNNLKIDNREEIEKINNLF